MIEPVSEERPIAVWAPLGRDGELILNALTQAGLTGWICTASDALCRAIEDESIHAAVVADEALSRSAIECVTATLREQPRWSDFPFIILTDGGRSTAESLDRLAAVQPLGHITIMERPLRRVTLITAVRAALQSRRRQYEVRDHLAEREQATTELMRHAEELVRSNADLQQFAYATSHDLKEPLRTMALYSQLLKSRYGGSLDGDAPMFIDFIAGSAAQMQRLVDGLLAYSRLVHTDATAPAPVDLEAVLNWATMNLQSVIDESHATITHDPLPTVAGVQVQLVQLFQNLIHNAIKYRDHRTPHIHISVLRETDHWRIGIKDNGVGIKSHHQEQIFDLFKRLHGKDIAGAGIGLALVRRIVEKHRGRIWVESEPGDGSTFWFTLADAGPRS